MDRSANDTTNLVPVTAHEGPALKFDWPALPIGVAEYEEGCTGCTVLRFPAGYAMDADVRGGSPGTVGG